MSSFNYTINQAKYEHIEKHLLQCSKLFSPALDSYVNITEYSKKIRDNAVSVEAWFSDNLIGLVACYLNNDKTKEGYITNVSVIHDYQGKGIAKHLINNTIKKAKSKNFKTLSLEVEVNNECAIELYRQTGFVLDGRIGDKYLMINRLLENKNVLLSICCVTYNHVNYLREAIESFLIQKTDFPFEILIHDDASTDGTAEIVIEYEGRYPEIIKPILQKENQYSKGRTISATYQFPRARGKYIALCEGDDYWTDPYKLQKQVDFLEANPAYGLVCTDYDTVKGGITFPKHLHNIRKMRRNQDITVEEYLLRPFTIRTLTVCFRQNFLNNYDHSLYFNNSMQNTSAGDVPLWLFIASRSKIKFLACSTSAYRITPNSISRQGTYTKRYLFSKSVIQTRRQFIENYPVSLRVKRKIEKTDIINELTYTYVTRDYNNFLKLFIKLLRKFYFSRKSIILFLGFLNSRFYVKISDKFKLT